MDLTAAGKTGRITDTVDYARVADEVRGLLRFREYQLIEVATEELAAMLFGIHPAVQATKIRLEKPEALRGRARTASVEIKRERAQFPETVSEHYCGEHALLLTTHEARLELFRIKPEATLELSPAPFGKSLEWKVVGNLTLDGKKLDRDPSEGACGTTHSYANLGPEMATLFRCEYCEVS
jgi:dihydroneopterin aldolase